ncbi:hypothetical protein EDC96DRAFT_573436 [Choanephora cucurbitarum]|nr:hypothetical protein EDC96DRAFT_573436 [Choanephora cucurbitarum]
MVQIPSSLLITSTLALQVSPAFRDTLKQHFDLSLDVLSLAEQRQVLTLFLVYCQYIDQNTVWSDYLSILPPVQFFEDHHVLFQPHLSEGTSLWHAVRAKLARLEQVHASLSIDWLSQVTLPMLLWADAVLWSRVVEIEPDQLALIPFFDFANHSQTPNLRWERSSDGIMLVNTEAVGADQELMLSYGSKPNQELLFIHGFCIPDNSVVSVVSLPWMPFFVNDPPRALWLRQTMPQSTLRLGLPDNEKEGIGRAGWDWTSVVIMYLAVLDSDEVEMVFTENGLELEGQTVTSLSELEQMVRSFEYFPVIQLRAIVLLIQALEYQLEQTSPITNHTSPLSSQVAIYQAEEQQMIHQSLEVLTELQNQLMTDPVVQAFLQANS